MQQRILGAAPENKLHELSGLHAACQPQKLQDRSTVQRTLKAAALVQQTQGIPHGAVCHPGQNVRSVGGEVDALLPGDIEQLPGDVLREDPLKGKALTAGKDGGRDLVQLRGGQDEHQMLRRLLQNLQQGVEGRGGEHMHLVDNVHTLFQHRRGIHRLLPKGSNIVHTIVAGGIQLGDVQELARINAPAGLALVAGSAVQRVQAVDGLGQDPGTGGFSGTPGAGEKVGVAGAALSHLALKCIGDVLLTDYLGKGDGPPLAVECLIHGPASLNKSIAELASAGAKKEPFSKNLF